MSEVSPICLKVGADSQTKFEIDILGKPIKINKNNGANFNSVRVFTKPIPCLIPIILITANPKNTTAKNNIRIPSKVKIVKEAPKISTKALATAASDNILATRAITAIRKPGYLPKAAST